MTTLQRSVRDEMREALALLGDYSREFSMSELKAPTLHALDRVLFDGLVVMIAGGRLPESRALRAAYPLSRGEATVFGDASLAGIIDAAWLNGVSMVSLELDEGNKYIRGHASAHVLPAVLALAEKLDCTGGEFLSAFAVGHEVASRFGSSVILNPGVHPHGNWGAAGAAAGCARILGADSRRISAAIDSATAMAMATPFSVATEGMPVRNAWIGSANAVGIWSSSIALSDEDILLVGIAEDSLGSLLGKLNVAKLTEGLGNEMFLETGYFKRHASCSYTHPPADAAIQIFDRKGPISPDMVTSIDVETHHLAAELNGTDWPTRMAAMFSVPYVVATALEHGSCPPDQFSSERRASETRKRLAEKVRVVTDEELDRRLPSRRAARLRIEWSDGSRSVIEVGNPIGDADNRPFDREGLEKKANRLIGLDSARAVADVVGRLADAPSIRPLLADLRRHALPTGEEAPDGHR